MIVKTVYLVSHKEGSYSKYSLADYTNFVVGSRDASKEPTDDHTLCTEEAEAKELAKRYETLNQLNARSLKLNQKQLDWLNTVAEELLTDVIGLR